MKYQALVDFSGTVDMAKDEVRSFDPNNQVTKDLLENKFIKPYKKAKEENEGGK